MDLEKQMNDALHRVRQVRRVVKRQRSMSSGYPWLPARNSWLADVKLLKLDWMERFIKKYKWMPNSFRLMCLYWGNPSKYKGWHLQSHGIMEAWVPGTKEPGLPITDWDR